MILKIAVTFTTTKYFYGMFLVLWNVIRADAEVTYHICLLFDSVMSGALNFGFLSSFYNLKEKDIRRKTNKQKNSYMWSQ